MAMMQDEKTTVEETKEVIQQITEMTCIIIRALDNAEERRRGTHPKHRRYDNLKWPAMPKG